QNWNNGKAPEYKERKEYVLANSVLKHVGPVPLECKLTETHEQEEKAHSSHKPGTALLFATETCPNCRIACNYLDKAGYPYQKLYVSENAELAKSLGVKQAPTLVLPDGTKLAGAGAIKGFLTKKA
ncbi:MAG: ribonucleoside triphosphate reductase, partial [Oscillospiraceae bacterium]|nr:ribonucleoside triphosphate reductase [Oscillospiraceae bacterium]